MVTAICDRAVAFSENAIIRVVSAQSITLEAKGSDSSLKINFMINNNNFPMMFYLLRFFRKGFTHRIIGNLFLEISIDKFDTIGSLNVSAYMFDDSTRPQASTRYTWENWDNKNYVASNNSIKKAFADHLEDLYEDLVDEELIANDCNPVVSNEKKEKRQTKIKSSKRKVVEKGANPKIIRTDLLSESLNNFVEFMNDDIPFPSDLFVPSGSMNI
ncbi:hypothetical protein BD560DRAFT_427578 [Blakeslea trispora]|nr:hypothetical protein BD560DRAFT_427578 [Blakeslea trispora]